MNIMRLSPVVKNRLCALPFAPFWYGVFLLRPRKAFRLRSISHTFPACQVSYNATIGSEIVQRTATLNVPANILDGHIIRLKGWGGSSSKGSPCGDLVPACPNIESRHMVGRACVGQKVIFGNPRVGLSECRSRAHMLCEAAVDAAGRLRRRLDS